MLLFVFTCLTQGPLLFFCWYCNIPWEYSSHIFFVPVPQGEPTPPPESKGGHEIQPGQLEPQSPWSQPLVQEWPKTSWEPIKTNPGMFSATMVKKILPFPHLELWGCEPGGGKGLMRREPAWSHTEERIQGGGFLMIVFRNLVPATADETYTSIHSFIDLSIKNLLSIYYVPGVLGLGDTAVNQSYHIPTLRSL